jgi:hypothetical protein
VIRITESRFFVTTPVQSNSGSFAMFAAIRGASSRVTISPDADFSFHCAATATAFRQVAWYFAARTFLGDEATFVVQIMDIDAVRRAIKHEQSSEAARSQPKSGDVKTSAEEFAALFRRVSEAPNREIEKLTNQLQKLRTQLESAGNRIQRDIAQYTELSQQTMQLTAIISDSVKKLPDGTRQAHRVLQ